MIRATKPRFFDIPVRNNKQSPVPTISISGRRRISEKQAYHNKNVHVPSPIGYKPKGFIPFKPTPPESN